VDNFVGKSLLTSRFTVFSEWPKKLLTNKGIFLLFKNNDLYNIMISEKIFSKFFAHSSVLCITKETVLIYAKKCCGYLLAFPQVFGLTAASSLAFAAQHLILARPGMADFEIAFYYALF
jgi:hypothetical protein